MLTRTKAIATATLLVLPVAAISAQMLETETTTYSSSVTSEGTRVQTMTRTVETDPLVINVPYGSTTLSDYAHTQPSLSRLARLLTATGLNISLTGPQAYTVFMPTDSAFNDLLPPQQKWLDKPLEHRRQITRVLNYHVVPGRLTMADLHQRIRAGHGRAVLTSLDGNPLYLSEGAGGVMISDARGMASYVAAEPDMPVNFPSSLFRVGALFVPL